VLIFCSGGLSSDLSILLSCVTCGYFFLLLGSLSWCLVTIHHVVKFLVKLRHFRRPKFDTLEIWTYTSCETLGSNLKINRKLFLGKPTRIPKTLTTCWIIITRRFFSVSIEFRFFNFQRLLPPCGEFLKKFFLLKIGFRLCVFWAQNKRNLRPSISKRSYQILNLHYVLDYTDFFLFQGRFYHKTHIFLFRKVWSSWSRINLWS
jgi:hypothetical protein